MNSVLDHINEEHEKKYGEICKEPHCGLHKSLCKKCSNEEKEQKRMEIIARNGNTGEHYE
jgi:hypothetical protein